MYARRAARAIIIGSVPFAALRHKIYAFSESDGKDPLNCKEYACASKLDMFKKAMKSSSKKVKNDAALDSEVKTKEVNNTTGNQLECPCDREDLGNSTWKLIHSIAANFPTEPTSTDKSEVSRFISSLAYLYPCRICADDFREAIATSPPKLGSRDDFILWCCEMHNQVNEKLGYPTFPCSVARLDERWKYGKPECEAKLHEQVNES